MKSYLVVRIEATRRLYHIGFDGEGVPIWGEGTRYAMQHQTAGEAVEVAERVAEVPWSRPGCFGVLEVGGQP